MLLHACESCLVSHDLHGNGAGLKETASASRVVGFNSRSQKKSGARRDKCKSSVVIHAGSVSNW